MIETIQNVGSVVGVILSCITLVTLIFKPLRTKFIEFIQNVSGSAKIDKMTALIEKHIADDEVNNTVTQHGLATLIGNEIKNIYNRFKDDKKLPEREFEILDKLYDVYHDGLHANGVIEKIYNEMKTWDIGIE